MSDESKIIEALKNTTAPPPPIHQPPPQLMALAKSIVDGVNTGQITSLAVIIAGPNGQIGWPAFGMQVAELSLGAEFLRDDLKTNMRGQKKILKAS